MVQFDKTISLNGFCPVQQKDYSITVGYNVINKNEYPKRYLQCGASCEFYMNQNGCEHSSDCPIREKAPNETTF